MGRKWLPRRGRSQTATNSLPLLHDLLESLATSSVGAGPVTHCDGQTTAAVMPEASSPLSSEQFPAGLLEEEGRRAERRPSQPSPKRRITASVLVLAAAYSSVGQFRSPRGQTGSPCGHHAGPATRTLDCIYWFQGQFLSTKWSIFNLENPPLFSAYSRCSVTVE